jgi:hypothetical protein
LKQKDALHAGRKPRPDKEGVTVKELANDLLIFKRALVDSGELKQRSWDDYKAACDLIVNHFGKGRRVDDLDAMDFAPILTAAEPLLATARYFAAWEHEGHIGDAGANLSLHREEEAQVLKTVLCEARLVHRYRPWWVTDCRRQDAATALRDLVTDKDKPNFDVFARRLAVAVELAREVTNGQGRQEDANQDQDQSPRPDEPKPDATSQAVGSPLPPGQAPVPPPTQYLMSWRVILDAVGMRNAPEHQRNVSKLNKQYDGPIALPAKGGQPKVAEFRLLE